MNEWNWSWAVSICLGTAIFIALLSAFFQMVMTRPLEKLQYTAPVSSLSIFLIGLAVWLDDSDWQSRIKVTFVALLLFFTNAVLTHATARAVRVRRLGHWRIQPSERAHKEIEIVKE